MTCWSVFAVVLSEGRRSEESRISETPVKIIAERQTKHPAKMRGILGFNDIDQETQRVGEACLKISC